MDPGMMIIYQGSSGTPRPKEPFIESEAGDVTARARGEIDSLCARVAEQVRARCF